MIRQMMMMMMMKDQVMVRNPPGWGIVTQVRTMAQS